MPYSFDKQKAAEENKPIEVEIHPAKKWKRILLYLGDMMLSFISCFVLFSAVVYPLSTLISPINGEETKQAQRDRDDILYGNKLLFYREDEYNQYDFTNDLKYTYHRFLSYYAFDSDEALIDSAHPEYAHLSENEIFQHYYLDIRSDNVTYLSLFRNYNEFFVVEGDNVSLISTVKESVRYFFDPEEKTESDSYKKLSEVFAAIYGKMMNNILDKNLSYEGISRSYVTCQKIIDKNASIYNWRMSISLLISYVLSTLIIHLIYPLINKRGHTPLMSIMKFDRVGNDNLKLLSKVEISLSCVYSLITDLPYLVFVPLSYTTFLTIFDLPLIVILALIGLLFILVSLFIILFHPFNRSAIDLLSRSIVVPCEDVDAVDAAKNYGK